MKLNFHFTGARYADAEIVRTRDLALLDTCTLVVDVGGVFDKDRHRYDHHQKTFSHSMNSLDTKKKWVTKLSSAGLVYCYFGKEIIAHLLGAKTEDRLVEKVFDKVYENFVEEIDAIDNGISTHDGEGRYGISTNLSSRVSHLGPNWNDANQDFDVGFYKAMDLTRIEFMDRVNYYGKVWWAARDIVNNSIQDRFKVHKSGKVLEFEQGGVPWKEHLFELEKENDLSGSGHILYVIYKDQNAMWRIQCVPLRPKSSENRLSLPEAWRGIRDQELEKVSGIEGATFLHSVGFIGGSKTRDGVISMLEVSLGHETEEAPSCKSNLNDGLKELGEMEKSFRQGQFSIEGNESLRAYYQGNIAEEMHKRMKGVLRWQYVEQAFDNIGVGKLGSIEEREAKEAALLERLKCREARGMEIESFVDRLTSLEDDESILERGKPKFFNDLSNLGIEPVCVQRRHTIGGMGNAQQHWETIVGLPGVEVHHFQKGTRKENVKNAKTKFLVQVKNITGSWSKQDIKEWVIALITEAGKLINFGSLGRLDEVTWSKMSWAPLVLASKKDFKGEGLEGNGWVNSLGFRGKVNKSKCEENMEKKKQKIEEVLKPMRTARKTEMGAEIWYVTKTEWEEVGHLVMGRMAECLAIYPVVAVDSEGHGATLQLTMVSSSSLPSFLFGGAWLPDEVCKLLWQYSPVMVGDRREFSRVAGSCMGMDQFDPSLIMRDIPGMNFSYGIKVLTKTCLGIDIDRIKELAGMHKKCLFKDMTLKELQYGHVRVSNWFSKHLEFFQIIYAVMDSEIYLRIILIAAFLEVKLRPLDLLKGNLTLQDVFGWWSWARNQTSDAGVLQRASNTNAREHKQVQDPKENFLHHNRGKFYATGIEVEPTMSVEDALLLGATRRELLIRNKDGTLKSEVWAEGCERRRKAELRKRHCD